ncbi:TonB-dependent receptor domain-containing protein [Marinimicrobium sp. ABcell2]|uniref:TonB-dependent receptor family protein n=1 Tax=Marinimicrobium sp. ABcell2 TaxID=3069751 RepID=UPI0027B1D880|nr:TonB-dependent receptor [Marinimicrobium sp. ABcell2]MDQ2078285.1 TonB-dependent receptor [Marinimicrobium sp. ABcell2]
MRTATLFLCAAITALGARAEVLETLIVTGDRNDAAPPVGHTRVSMDDQQPGMRIDSAELLQGLPGVQADSRSNYAQDTRLTLRGFGARSAFGVRGIDLLVDGIPLGTPDGQGQLSSVMLDEVHSVRVLRGPLAALYGNGAGGVINLETLAPQETRVMARALVGEGDRQRQALTGEWRQDSLAARVQGSRFTSEGERPHAEAERRHLGGQLYYTSPTGVETTVRVDTSQDPLLQDPLGLTPEQWREDPNAGNPGAETFNTRKQLRHRQASARVRQAEGTHRWELALWRGQREVDQWLAFPGSAITSSGAVIDLTRDFTGARGNYGSDFHLWGTPAQFSVGVTLSEMEDRRRGFVNNFGETGELRRDELGRVRSRDVHSLLEWQPAPAWDITSGVRYSRLDFNVDDFFIVPPTEDSPGNPDDSGSTDYDYWSGAIGVSRQLGDDWELYGGTGRGFETPTLTEMAYRSEGTGLNTDLRAARNEQHEVGLRYGEPGVLSVDLSLFWIDSRDELVVDQSEGGRTTFRNAAATERRGVELSGDWLLAPGLWARYSASYLDAEYSRGEWAGNRLPGIADTNLYTQLRWEPWLDPRLSLALVGRYRGEVATGDDNEVFAPSSTVWDFTLRSQHSWSHWGLDVWTKVANLTDATYVGSVIVNQGHGRSFEPAPGRNLSAGLTLDYRW